MMMKGISLGYPYVLGRFSRVIRWNFEQGFPSIDPRDYNLLDLSLMGF